MPVMDLLWLVPALPLMGFIVLALRGKHFSKRAVALTGAGSVGLSAIIAIAIGVRFIASSSPAFTRTLWTWMSVGGFAPRVSLYLDALSLVMVLVVTVVGFLIHLYSAEYMEDEEGYSRFFAYMNLFVGSMLTLVLADNFLLLYLGWEGVGLCSYLLIGFWYKDKANGLAAIKAFVVTRVGDVALAIALFIIFWNLGTLDIQAVMQRASGQWQAGPAIAVAAAALILGGAVGKSAQLPLQTWLPDAMAGPTPVSALIHAATMVTAGVYLIARTHVLFALAPEVRTAVAVVGAATLLLAATSALVQRDIKRVLAYSTISQIGYMFLALGVSAWQAAIFHLMTHAFFKALLFLAAGSVITAMGGEHDIFKMGGLRKKMPIVFWTFLAGAASLSALPLITAGFYSKDLILWRAWSSPDGSRLLWAAGVAGALLTSFYAFRMVYTVFYGDEKKTPEKFPGPRIAVPLIVLAVLSVAGGLIQTPAVLGGVSVFSRFIGSALPPVPETGLPRGPENLLGLLAAAASVLGLYLAYLVYLRRPGLLKREFFPGYRALPYLREFLFSGWGFDRLYGFLFVRPYIALSRANKGDFLDSVYTGIARLNVMLHKGLSATQTGKVRWYASAIALGAALLLAAVVFS